MNEPADMEALLDLASRLTDLGYQIEAHPDDVDIPALIAQLRSILAELEAM